MRAGDVEFGIELRACQRSPSNRCVYDTCIIKSILDRSCDSLVLTLISFHVSQVRGTVGRELGRSATGLGDGTGRAACRGKPEVIPPPCQVVPLPRVLCPPVALSCVWWDRPPHRKGGWEVREEGRQQEELGTSLA